MIRGEANNNNICFVEYCRTCQQSKQAGKRVEESHATSLGVCVWINNRLSTPVCHGLPVVSSWRCNSQEVVLANEYAADTPLGTQPTSRTSNVVRQNRCAWTMPMRATLHKQFVHRWWIESIWPTCEWTPLWLLGHHQTVVLWRMHEWMNKLIN